MIEDCNDNDENLSSVPNEKISYILIQAVSL